MLLHPFQKPIFFTAEAAQLLNLAGSLSDPGASSFKYLIIIKKKKKKSSALNM